MDPGILVTHFELKAFPLSPSFRSDVSRQYSVEVWHPQKGWIHQQSALLKRARP